ncbi:MAG: protease modulator HflC [Phycisphaeraceae bacterium]|nr:protease modulator HflC [Phycisphaeraceae bacterium]
MMRLRDDVVTRRPPPEISRSAILAILSVVVVLLGALVLYSAAFVVDEADQVIVLQFGEPRGEPITEPGLHFKLPFIQNIVRFDKRLLSWDGDPNQIPTRGEQFILVDTTARWRIADPLMFYQRVRDVDGGIRRLNDILDSVVRDKISASNLTEIVRSSDWTVTEEDLELLPPAGEDEAAELMETVQVGREELVREILNTAREGVTDFGVELVDIRIKRVDYVQQVQEQVFQRMIAERQRMAEQFRSEGQGRAAEIDGETERQLAQIRSEARREAEVIRGNADAQATAIYNEAFGADPEFYAFFRTLESYSESIGRGVTMILNADSEYFRYLRDIGQAPEPRPVIAETKSE